jgi:hypothetical protein
MSEFDEIKYPEDVADKAMEFLRAFVEQGPYRDDDGSCQNCHDVIFPGDPVSTHAADCIFRRASEFLDFLE